MGCRMICDFVMIVYFFVSMQLLLVDNIVFINQS